MYDNLKGACARMSESTGVGVVKMFVIQCAIVQFKTMGYTLNGSVNNNAGYIESIKRRSFYNCGRKAVPGG